MIIKRDGVSVMNARTKNVSLAKETLEILKQKKYTAPSGTVRDISGDLDAAIKGTVLYKDSVPTKGDLLYPTTEVTNETTAQAAVRLASLGKTDIVALNFASARNQGGGFLSGAIAQEEDLCRCSGLYACLKNKPVFYNENILCDNCFYTENILYSPRVPFFRDQYNLFLENPFTLSIISAPSPNVRGMEQVDEKELYDVLVNRATRILQIAENHGHRNLILGAWGCGAFGNDPHMVGTAFTEALSMVPAFEHVCFAVYDTREPPVLFDTFKLLFP